MKRIYAIYDLVANIIVGSLVLDHSDASVIRLFHDLCQDTNTAVGRHPKDYELRYVGQLANDGQLLPVTPQVVATGAAWLAAQTPAQDRALDDLINAR